MNPTVRSAVFAGIAAGIIYAVIAFATGSSFGSVEVLGVALIIAVATAAISFIISMLLGSRGTDRERNR